MTFTKAHIRQRAFNGSSNFMTPTFIEDHLDHNYYIELSSGRGFTGDPIYGVTVINAKTCERENDLSELFHDRLEAYEHMESLLNDDVTAPDYEPEPANCMPTVGKKTMFGMRGYKS